MEQNEDYDLVQLALKDPDSYKLLVDKYESKLLRYIRRVLIANNADSEDVLQEVFIKAYKNLNSYDKKYKFSSWIFRIAHNETIDFIRRNSRRKKGILFRVSGEDIEDLASDLDLEAELLKKDSSDMLANALSELDAKYRDVLVLKYLEEMDYNEISEILRIPQGTVGSLISRAKVKLKRLLKQNEQN